MVDLIPKQERKPLFGQWFFLIASALLLGGVGVGFLVLNHLEGNAREILAGLDEILIKDTQPQEQALIEKLTETKGKIERFQLAASQRKDFLPLFTFLEESTFDGVVLQAFEANRISDELLITGIADTFFVLEQQRLLWVQHEQVQKIQITSINLGATGSIGFEAAVSL